MAARTKTKVSPKYKTKYRVKNWAVRYRSQRARRHHGLVRRGGDLRIEPVGSSAIASDLSMDRTSISAQGPRDLSHGFLMASQRPNGVSFFTGDLVIRQRSLPSFAS